MTTTETTPEDFVIVEGGLVRNDPALPVFDLDVLSSDLTWDEISDDVFELLTNMSEHQTHTGMRYWVRYVTAEIKRRYAPLNAFDHRRMAAILGRVECKANPEFIIDNDGFCPEHGEDCVS